jgi:hypothetical protein
MRFWKVVMQRHRKELFLKRAEAQIDLFVATLRSSISA